MIAICTPDEDPRIVAQHADVVYSLGRATNRRANLDLIVRGSGGEMRFSLTFWDIHVFVGLVEDSLRNPGRFIGLVSNDLTFSYDALRVEIKQGSQRAEMPQWIAGNLAEALRGYAV